MIHLELPLCPSLNNMYGNSRQGRNIKQHYREWIQEAGWDIQLARPRPGKVTGPYRVSISFPVTVRGDIDNRIKPIMDILVKHGITPDDRHAVSVAAERNSDVLAGRCVVKIEEA